MELGVCTSLACSRVNLARGRGGNDATAGSAGAGPEASGSVRIVTCELSTAETSKTEEVSGEAERWRVVVDVEGGD